MEENVIEVKNFSKTYGSFVAVDGISFEVHRGESSGCWAPTVPARPARWNRSKGCDSRMAARSIFWASIPATNCASWSS